MHNNIKPRLAGPESFLKNFKRPEKHSLAPGATAEPGATQSSAGAETLSFFQRVPVAPSFSPPPQYPTFRHRKHGISSVLREPALAALNFETPGGANAGEDVSEKPPQERVKRLEDRWLVVQIVAQFAMRVSGLLAYILVLFFALPHKLSEKNLFDILYTAYSSLLLFFALPDFLPRMYSLPGLNALNDRKSPLLRWLGFSKINEQPWLAALRLFFLTILLCHSRDNALVSGTVGYICVALALYYTGFYVVFSVFSILSMKNHAQFSDFYSGNEHHFDEEFFADTSKEKWLQLGIRSVCIALAVAVTIIFFVFDHKALPLLSMILLWLFALLFIIEIFIIFREKKAFLSLIQIRIVLVFFVFLVLDVAKAIAPFTCRAILSVVCYIFAFSNAALYLVLLYKERDTSKISPYLGKPAYMFVLGGALLIAVALMFAVSLAINLQTGEYAKKVVEFVVSWCVVATPKQRERYYQLSLSDNEVILKVILFTLASPLFLFLAFSAYFMLADRAPIFKRAMYWNVGAFVTGLSFVALVFLSTVSHMVEQNWSWKSFAETKSMRLVDLKGVQRFSHAGLAVGMTIVFCYAVLGYDEVKTGGGDPTAAGESGSSAEKSAKGERPFLKRALSTLLAVALLILVYSNVDFSGAMITVARSTAPGFHQARNSAVVPASECDSATVAFVSELGAQVATHVAAIKNTQAYNQRAELVRLFADPRSQAMLVLLPTAVLALQILANGLWKAGVVKGSNMRRISTSLLFLGIAGFFFSSFMFPAFFVYTYALVFPFHKITATDGYFYALVLSTGGVLVPVVALFENLAEMVYLAKTASKHY